MEMILNTHGIPYETIDLAETMGTYGNTIGPNRQARLVMEANPPTAHSRHIHMGPCMCEGGPASHFSDHTV